MSDYPFLIRDCIPVEFIDYTKKYVETNFSQFMPNPNGPNRRFMMFGDDEPFIGLKQVLAGRFDITDWVLDPYFRNFIGYQTIGGSVHPHTDPSIDGRLHTRINIMVSLPQSGGLPVLDDIPVPVAVGDVWLNLADTCKHRSTDVVGDIPRIVLSLGMQVKETERKFITARYHQWRIQQ